MSDSDLARLNELAPAMHDGFRLRSFDGWKLIIAGSQDRSYYHNVEIVCTDPQHIDLACIAFIERAEIAREKEWETIRLYDDEGNVHRITAEKFELIEVNPQPNPVG